jgi:hypothetical protein
VYGKFIELHLRLKAKEIESGAVVTEYGVVLFPEGVGAWIKLRT